MIKDTARLILTRDCPRNCVGCCNEQFKFDGDVYELDKKDYLSKLEGYNTVILSGGEPLLLEGKLFDIIDEIEEEYPCMRFILYTSFSTIMHRVNLNTLLHKIDGITFSVHIEEWEKAIKEVENLQWILNNIYDGRPNQLETRISIDNRIPAEFMDCVDINSWNVINVFKWISSGKCPPSPNEDLYYLPL